MFEQEHFQYKDIIFFINRKRKTNQLNKNYCKLLGVDYKRKQQRRPQAEAERQYRLQNHQPCKYRGQLCTYTTSFFQVVVKKKSLFQPINLPS
jgi:hypothetical protein